MVQTHFASRRVKLIVAAVVILLVVVGAFMLMQKQDKDQAAETASQASGPPKKTGNDLKDKQNLAVYNLGSICGKDGKAFAEAEAYRTGAAPHHYAVLSQSIAGDYNKMSAGPGFDDFKIATLETPRMQLVGCLTRTIEKKTNVVCNYEDGTKTQLYNTEYVLDIYETKTRQHLKMADIIDAGQAACPAKGSGLDVIGPGPKAYVGPDKSAISNAFSDLIQ